MIGKFFLLSIFLLWPLLALGIDSKEFVNLAMKSVDFQIPDAEKLIVDGRVLNPQVLSECKIEEVYPINRLTVRRVGNYLIQLRVKCKKSFLSRTLNVNLHVDARAHAYVTTETVERGEHLTGKIKRKEILLSQVRGSIFKGDIGKVVAKVRLLPDTVVLQRFVEVPFAVKRGQLVRIVAKKNGIYVETTGRALQSGHVGDTIKVKNIYSKKVIEGKVKDEETVVVPF
jgi:flagella basal body P-ring formation protein FlgA